jgi:hypothetical protein
LTLLYAAACATPKVSSVPRNFDYRGQREASFTGTASWLTSGMREHAPSNRRFGQKKKS